MENPNAQQPANNVIVFSPRALPSPREPKASSTQEPEPIFTECPTTETAFPQLAHLPFIHTERPANVRSLEDAVKQGFTCMLVDTKKGFLIFSRATVDGLCNKMLVPIDRGGFPEFHRAMVYDDTMYDS